MTDLQIFTSRLKGRPLLDSEGLTIGRIRDVVILPAAGSDPPRALGLVVTLQRRRIFVNLGLIAEISVDGAYLRGATVDLDRFTRRTGEILASELYGKRTEAGTVVDVAIGPAEQRRVGWQVSAFAVSARPWPATPRYDDRALGQIPGTVSGRCGGRATGQPARTQAGRSRHRCRGHAGHRRSQIAAALDDEELADLLEEMPEQDQVRLLASLGLERSADVRGGDAARRRRGPARRDAGRAA